MQKKSLYQFARFVLVGGLNTVIDFGLLNLLILAFGLHGESGGKYFLFKGISFTLATLNSFFFNKRWVFRQGRGGNGALRFAFISVIGLGLNVLVASLVFVQGPRLIVLNPKLWANIGALSGTAFVLLANFFGYKYFVFNKNTPSNG